MANRDAEARDSYVPTSTYAIQQSFGGHNHFMASYGLKPGEEDEARAITDAMKESDRLQWEEEHEQERGQEISGETVDDYERYEDAGVYAGADPTAEEELAGGGYDGDEAEYYVEGVDGDAEGGYGDQEDGVVDGDAYDDADADDYEDDEDEWYFVPLLQLGSRLLTLHYRTSLSADFSHVTLQGRARYRSPHPTP